MTMTMTSTSTKHDDGQPQPTTATLTDSHDSDSDSDDDGPENQYVRELFAFPTNHSDSDNADDDEDDDDGDDENPHPLISHYVQSFKNINISHDDGSSGVNTDDADVDDDGDTDGGDNVVDMHYYLALLARGHGNSVWNSSRCIAEHLMDDTKRHELLNNFKHETQTLPQTSTTASDRKKNDDDDDYDHHHHPISRLSVLELGAGGALPSLAMLYVMMRMNKGKKMMKKNNYYDKDVDDIGSIVISDLVDTDGLTFEAIRKSIRRNIKSWGSSTLLPTTTTTTSSGTTHADEIPKNVHIVSHVWGESVHPLLDCINDRQDGDAGEGGDDDETDLSPTQQQQNKYFNVIIASDCIYNPTHHHALLSSVNSCLGLDTNNTEGGRFVVGYSYHPNVPPAQVESFFDMASSPEFNMEVVFQKIVEYQEGQTGIGSTDPDRGTVYLKVLRRRKVK